METDHDYLFIANKAGFIGNRLGYHSLYAVFKEVSKKTEIELNFLKPTPYFHLPPDGDWDGYQFDSHYCGT